LAVIKRDLADSAVEGLSADGKLNAAFNAALQAATAALAAAGYRASRDQRQYRVIHSLRETVGAEAAVVNTLDAFRKKRNITGYERAGLVSDADAEAMRKLAIRLRDDIIAWMRKHHAQLTSKITGSL
jgi:hypothetical protein